MSRFRPATRLPAGIHHTRVSLWRVLCGVHLQVIAMTAPIERYLERHGIVSADHAEAESTTRASVVIPAKAERNTLPRVVDSLVPLPDWAELIVVVNNGPGASEAVVENNRETAAWLNTLPATVVIDRYSPGREILEGGVGHARRLGMDTALARMHHSGTTQRGFIACLDADSPVDPGYLNALDDFFRRNPAVVAGVCHYEHDVHENPAWTEAIVEYEIWLRYWEEGLHAARSPYAFQNLGSCMVATAAGYAAIDGMPQLDSAQDFYFLEKAVKYGGPGAVRTIGSAVVRPSARPSDRVPHGTGRALADILSGHAGKYRKVPPASVFYDLRRLFTSLEELFESDAALESIADDLLGFLERRCGSKRVLTSIRETAPDARRFARSFHAWFSASRQIQYANEAGAHRGWESPAVVFRELADLREPLAGHDLLSELRHRARARGSMASKSESA